MGRELKRVAPGSEWEDYSKPGPAQLDEDPPYQPGAWFQMWQTVSDKPYTPAFETAEELAQWCADHPWGAEKDNPIPAEVWLQFINGPGLAPSAVASAGCAPISGVAGWSA